MLISNSLGFPLSENIFILFLRIIFLDIEFGVDSSFLVPEKYCPTAFESPHSLIKKTFCFVLFCFNFLPFFSFQKFNYDVPWHGFLWIYSPWASLSFLNLKVYDFHQMTEVFGHCAFKYFANTFFLLFFWHFVDTNAGICILVPQIPENVFFF